MAITTKQIGNSKYAYLSFREGDRIVQKYLGPLDDSQVRLFLEEKKKSSRIPESLSVLYWDARLEEIKLKENARYVIERVLQYGDLDALNWLQRVYPSEKILDVIFISRTLTEKSKNFWRIWFGVNDA